MLRNRIITALVLVLAVLSILFWLPFWVFALLFGIVTLIGAWEWSHLLPEGFGLPDWSLIASVGAMLVILWFFPQWHMGLLWLAVGGWIVAAVLIVGFRSTAAIFAKAGFIVLSALLFLCAAWIALLHIRDRPEGALWLLWAFAMISAADIGAYFTGKQFGRRRLAPKISPGKTWEGVIGGSIASLGVGYAGLALLGGARWEFMVFIPLFVATSVFGDLFESALKRASGVKDSSHLLPGHGGVLDRIDSMVAALPPVALALAYLT